MNRMQSSLNQQSVNRNGFNPVQPQRNLKPYILVISISLLIGVGIFFFTKDSNNKVTTPTAPREIPANVTANTEDSSGYYPSPIAKPTPPSLDKNSNLEAETEKLDPKDYSEDFKNLRDQL